jgi:peroxiredoxin
MQAFRFTTPALVVLALAGMGRAADKAPDDKTGLAVGAKAPAFTLKDQDGKERTLDKFLKKGPVALVFYRSAGWWPFCQKQLVQLQADLEKTEKDIQVIAISYDSVEVLAKFADKHKITFPLLSDPDSKTISAYGLLNKEAKGSKVEGIAYPGTMLLDKDGAIRAKLFVEGFKERHSTDDLIKAAKSIK